jgi:hypothetical protein
MTHTSVRVSVYLLLMCCVLPVMAQNAASADSVVPGMVKFAGTLNDTNGKPLTGTVGVTFLLYTEQSAGPPLWMETQNVQADKTGHYSVMLGSATSHGIPADAFAAGQARWLAVQPSGQAEQPRVELGSVPYALKAADAQTLGGLPPSAFLLAATPASTVNAVGAGTETSQTQAVGTKPVTTAGGTAQALAKFDGTADIANSQIFDNGTNVGIGTNSPQAKLDVKGAGIFQGTLTLPATGTATATAGKNSQPLNLAASAFDSSIGQALNETFRWQAETAGNNTTKPSGKLNLLFGSGANAPSETGLSVSSKGVITFASGQTFPGTGTGTVTSVGTGLGLTGGPITHSGTLAIDTSVVPQLAANNNFRGNQSITGDITSGGNVNASGNVTANGNLSASNLFVTGLVDAGNGVFGHATAPGNVGITFGVLGDSASDTGRGVFGFATGATGVGVWGRRRVRRLSRRRSRGCRKRSWLRCGRYQHSRWRRPLC